MSVVEIHPQGDPKAQFAAEKVKRRRERLGEIPTGWKEWLRTFFPRHFTAPFAPHHERYWEHVWTLEKGTRPRPLVFCLARKGGKSTAAEATAVVAGTPKPDRPPSRTYVLYVSGTQDQADDHVRTIASHIEESDIRKYYPDVAEARVDEYGDRWGWKRDRLVTEAGLIVDAYGLFGAGRGAKIEEYRPDLIILDDIDEEDDSIDVVKKKRDRIQQQVIPAGSNDRAILFIQNVVHRNSVMNRLLTGEDEWLLKRKEIGPIPAATGLSYTKHWDADVGRNIYEITSGEPTWDGFDLEDIEDEINDVGPTSFLVEYQHEVEKKGGGIFEGVDFIQMTLPEAMERTAFVRKVLALDPAVSSTDESDCMAIQVDALGTGGLVYRLFSWEEQTTPEKALRKALSKAVQLGVTKIVIESDQGGETWKSVAHRAWEHLVESEDWPHISSRTRRPFVAYEKAASTQKSKQARGMEMLEEYERGEIIHVTTGTHLVLEKALNRAFETKPFDLADAAYWSWQDLRGKGAGKAHDIN